MHFDLPRYPWQRQRLHDELPEHTQTKFGTPDTYSMLGDPDLHARFAWELHLNRQTLPWLADHVVDGLCVLPGAAYLDAALSAASLRTGLNSVTAEDIRFVAPLIVDPADGTILRTELDESSRRFTIRSRGTTSTFWTVHATGRLVEATYLATKHPLPDTRDMSEIDPADFYAGFAARGLDYGHHFQRVTSLRVGSMAAIATVEALSEPDTTRHLVHPCLIDAALQTVAPLVEQSIGRHHGTLVPIAVDAVRAFAPLPDQVTVVARRHPTDPLCADYVILDSEHTACMQLMDVRLGPIVPGKEPIDRLAPLFYEELWDLRDQLSTTAPPTSQQTATLVVALGDKPHVRARQLFEALPHSGYHDCTRTAELEADLTQRLSEVAGTLPRLHVCLVVGDIADDFAALCVLKRIAVTIEKFLDEQLGDRAAEMSPFGDDTFYVSLITERAFVHPNDASVPNTSHAALAGARRVLLGEQPRLRWRLIDTDEATEIPDLSAELAVPGAFCHDHADEVLLRSGLRWTPIVTQTLPQRLEAMARNEQFAEPEANFTVEAPKSRLLTDLGWRRCPRPSPGRGEVELQMEAVGLHYKDAVKALGLLGERELEQTHFRTHLGMEGVGVVSHVGPEVAELQIGDVVATAAQGMLTRYHIADAALCFKLPNPGGRQAVRPEHCASITAFVTAEHSLLTLSRLQPGETVLIQGAAGGVGSAAIQVAKLCGARVIGTASTDQRRCYALAADADHMIDSRSLNFVDDVRELTWTRRRRDHQYRARRNTAPQFRCRCRVRPHRGSRQGGHLRRRHPGYGGVR